MKTDGIVRVKVSTCTKVLVVMARTRCDLSVVKRNSYVTGFHVYKEEWEPKIGETLQAEMDPKNDHDPFAISVRKGNQVVGHLERGVHFAQTIFYFLRADETAQCVVTIEGKPTNLGDKLGQKVPCSLRLTGQTKFIKVLKTNLH